MFDRPYLKQQSLASLASAPPETQKAVIKHVSNYKSPLRYPGGKQRALAQIEKMLPSSAKEYREPLIGGASVYFHVKSKCFAKQYWINDKFHELVCFWKTLQDPDMSRQLIIDLEILHSNFSSPQEIKAFFQQAKHEVPKDNYNKALFFFFFNRVTFSGTTKAGGFSQEAALKRFTISSIMRLQQASKALEGTLITEGDFEPVITKPGDDVFIFLDPPYYKATKLYGHKGSLHAFDHQRLATTLQKSPHRFLITYDDCPEIRKLYNWCNIKGWSLQYGMNNCNKAKTSKVGAELFITNY